jgi:hypothetical protein
MVEGDRVRLSNSAKRAGILRTRDQERRGTFVGLEKGFYIKVLWDGNKSFGTGYHPDYIDLDTPHLPNGKLE